jgi:4-hydroxy-3-methylbut-2-en-1-yl diphosphate reductase
MRVLLASPRGFCAGVNMAIDALDLAIQSLPPPIYVYHEIVHNKYVVNRFREQGVVFVDHLTDVPPESTLLFSAHGVSPEIRQIARERNLRAIDATCPLVTKVHLEAIKYASQGYTILLIGHEGHDEVIGTMGEAPEAILLVETPEAVDHLKVADETKVAYLTQTTPIASSAGSRNDSPTSSRRRRMTSATPRKTVRKPWRFSPPKPT